MLKSEFLSLSLFFEPYYHMVMGVLQRLMELIGTNNIRYQFVDKGWQGAPATRAKVTWD